MYLLIGGDSGIGAATAALMRDRGLPAVTTSRRPQQGGSLYLDFDDAASFEPPAGTAAACIFVAVARLQDCARDPAGSRRVNVTQTLALAERLAVRGIHTLYLSTNQVFDGRTPRVTADAPHSPVSEYGRQKAETERTLMTMIEQGAPIAILRFAKVVPPRMALFADWDRDLRAGRPVKAFTDMMMAPVPMGLAAEATVAMLAARPRLVAQISGPRDIAYADAARFIARRVGADESLVVPASAYDIGLPVGATPANTTLDGRYLAERFGLIAPDAYEVVSAAVA